MKTLIFRISILLVFCLIAYSTYSYSTFTRKGFISQYSISHSSVILPPQETFFSELTKQAELRTLENVKYDGRYLSIGFPMGDVPENIGVCTDVVIRTYRALGIDLQEMVHADMSENFLSYPKMWGLLKPDTNIDHRRVPNLMTFFNRMGASLAISDEPDEYAPGNVVSWDLGGGTMHIGIVSSKKSHVSGNPLIVHNIASGPKLDDILFKYKIIGHYRYSDFQSQER